MTPPQSRTLLPMIGRTHGNRSAVTCHLRCGDACSMPVPNTTETSYFRDIATTALSRRSVVATGVAAAALSAVTVTPAAADPGVGSAAPGRPRKLPFTPIAPPESTLDAMRVPLGYRWDAIIRWGDPILAGAPAFDPAKQTPEAQATQFGYNNDYLDIIETSRNGTSALLVCNHEYTNETIMFPPGTAPETVIRTAMAAHGMSVVELTRRKRGDVWSYVPGARLNRRITMATPFAVDGPAAGSDLLKTRDDSTGRTVLGTLNNCAGGTTPWGTVLSGEENFNQYFKATGGSANPREARYGLGANGDGRNWRLEDPRFDATTAEYKNEPNRFGWIVEVDPSDPTSTPVKHTAMGRFKHEGATVIVNGDGHVVAYMGDDERFDYVYRFVSRDTMRPGKSPKARKHNLGLLSEGDLSVARFTGDGLGDGVSDGTGEWIPLTKDGRSTVPGFSIEEVLVYTRLAADAVQPTKMDRPEDVEPSLRTGRIYVACTNNTARTTTDEANPRPRNKDGHVVEMIPTDGDHTLATFSWNLILICGDAKSAGTYFGGYTGPVSPISCPDNVAFDSEGNLWVSTDGQPSAIGLNDGLFQVPVEGPERGRVQQFLAVPAGAETCGPVIRDLEGSVFVAVQHPGEDGTFATPQSRFPDYVPAGGTPAPGAFAGPRPSVVQVTRS